MAWSTPMTAVANDIFTAAQFNAFVRDNLNETMPFKATQANSYFVGSGDHSMSERKIDSDLIDNGVTESTASTSFTDVDTVGPSVSMVTGPVALILFTCAVHSRDANSGATASFEVSGATTIAASEQWGCHVDGRDAGAWCRLSTFRIINSLTPGLNTFTAKYVTYGANEIRTKERRIIVMSF